MPEDSSFDQVNSAAEKTKEFGELGSVVLVPAVLFFTAIGKSKG